MFLQKPPKHFSTFRDETSGMVEGFSGRIPISKNDSNWQQHPHMQFKNLQILQSQPMLMEMLLKIILVELKKTRERNLPLYLS